jgi:glycosyltransferase involved in cell wall biosynthesis
MLPQSIKEKTTFIGNSKNISSMLKTTLNIGHLHSINKIFSKDKPNYVYLHNYHLLNHYIAKVCRKNGGKFIYHVHEPYVENKAAHGGVQRYWLYLNEYMEAKLVSNTDIAIVSSKEASRLFNKAYPHFKGKKIQIPLLYEDLGAGQIDSLNNREYVTFVGPPVSAKGPEIFLNIVNHARKSNPEWRFLMISREKIKDPKFLKVSNLSIFYQARISDEEYGILMKKSVAVVTPYKRETQSSVILVSYMYGTPVVSSNVGGLPEFVDNGDTGYIVDLNAPIEKWIEAIQLIKTNSQFMQNQCREYFKKNFAGSNWQSYLNSVLT